MILVDTSIWIDHLHNSEPQLVRFLEDALVAIHVGIIEELALGSINNRSETLALFDSIEKLPTLSHDELRLFIDTHQLWGRGLSSTDVHLLGSTLLANAQLWTRDKRLKSAATELGAALEP